MARSNKQKFIDNYMSVCLTDSHKGYWLVVDVGDGDLHVICVSDVRFLNGKLSFRGISCTGKKITTYNKKRAKIYWHMDLVILRGLISESEFENKAKSIWEAGIETSKLKVWELNLLNFLRHHEAALVAWKQKQKEKMEQLKKGDEVDVLQP